MSLIRSAYFILYVVVPLGGIALNIYVFSRLLRIARRSRIRFCTTSALPLSAMSVSDSICLLAELTQALFHYTVKQNTYSVGYLSLICKIDLYLMHATSAFSVWCWVVLSMLRYVAVFHPFKYRTIWRQPRCALQCLCITCVASEMWILYYVIYDKNNNSCSEDPSLPPKHIKSAIIMDILLFYAVPSIIRILLDVIVLFRCYSWTTHSLEDSPSLYSRRPAISAPSMNRRTSSVESDVTEVTNERTNLVLFATISMNQTLSKTRKEELLNRRRTTMILRSLLISVLNLLCNLPSHILRAYVTLAEPDENEWLVWLEPLSQVLYFSQFTCNVFYLSTSIYETTIPQRNAVIINRQFSRWTSKDEDM